MFMIQVLSTETIQKIAAGEVIERPVSVVKELVENSIDAGADSIIVEIRKGGKEYIHVQDNGSGIEKDDFETAFERHATSKISDFDDLYRIHSLGFRGEALASIVSVSRVSARSKTEPESLGSELQYENSKLISKKPMAMSTGSEIVVEDLFFHVPVRKKFLKSDQAEGNQITSLMYSLAVGNPQISFQFIKDGRHIFQTNKDNSFEENLMVLFGLTYFESLITIQGESENFNLRGSIGDNTYFRANRQMQFLYVNGRYVEHEEIRKIIEDLYKTVIPNGRFPAYQLFIETNPANIDINIHPNKQKINFFEFDKLASLVEETVKEALFARPRLSQLESADNPKGKSTILQDLSSDDAYQKILQTYQWNSDQGNQLVREDGAGSAGNQEAESDSATLDDEKDLFDFVEIADLDEDEINAPENSVEMIIDSEEVEQEEFDHGVTEEESLLPPWPKLRFQGIIFKTYIMLEDGASGDLLLIDQHAAHERINYEKFIRQFNSGEVVSQVLINPDHIKLTELQSEELKGKTELLEEMGFSFSFLGERDLVLREVPVLFHQPELGDLFTTLIDTDTSSLRDMDDIVHRLATKACKASVKQGDVLSTHEVESLYQELGKCDYPLTCPHGRPTLVRVSKKEFEKLFYRIK